MRRTGAGSMLEIVRGYLVCGEETQALVGLRVTFAHSIFVAVRDGQHSGNESYLILLTQIH